MTAPWPVSINNRESTHSQSPRQSAKTLKESLFQNRFLVVAPTIQQTRCKKWLMRHLPARGGITVDDVTSSYSVINIIGPLARDLMNNFGDMSQATFPFFTCQV
jgi:glycine cleavage system aminomethyltransferase T